MRAREAYDRGDWAVAFDQLRTVGNLGVDDTLALATSAYLTGDVDQAVRALQAGYQDMIKNGDTRGAVRFAFWLALILDLRGEAAISGCWVARAQRLLENEADDIVERGYMLIHDFFQHVARGDFAAAGEA